VPARVNGVDQKLFDAISMAYTLTNPDATIAGKDPLHGGADELPNVGLDTSVPSADIYSGVLLCPGKIQKVEIELK
jgi:hypothetical protein